MHGTLAGRLLAGGLSAGQQAFAGSFAALCLPHTTQRCLRLCLDGGRVRR